VIDFSRPAPEVAPLVLGGVLRHGGVAVRLTEVEAYAGTLDPASHAFRGPTPRASVMFGEPSRLYVYLSYGVHLCGNLVCSPAGEASAVLLRAGEVVEGLDLARERRTRPGRRAPDHLDLARGPGNLGRALGFTLADSGTRVSQTGDADYDFQPATQQSRISVGPRVGISRAVDVPWRFWLDADPSVTRTPR